jgi:dTMP kinase
MTPGTNRPERHSGLLITFEGPEGSGKTTLVHALTERLVRCGAEPVVVREPGGTDAGEAIRQVLLDPAGAELCAEAELLLMIASRAQLVREKLKPSLAAGMIVLCDRFADASVAYQGWGRELGTEVVRQLNAFALDGLTPDLTFLCLLDPEEGRARLAGRDRATDRLDRETLAFHRRVYEGYREMEASGDPRFAVLDATASPAAMLEAALVRLRRLEHGLLKYV